MVGWSVRPRGRTEWSYRPTTDRPTTVAGQAAWASRRPRTRAPTTTSAHGLRPVRAPRLPSSGANPGGSGTHVARRMAPPMRIGAPDRYLPPPMAARTDQTGRINRRSVSLETPGAADRAPCPTNSGTEKTDRRKYPCQLSSRSLALRHGWDSVRHAPSPRTRNITQRGIGNDPAAAGAAAPAG